MAGRWRAPYVSHDACDVPTSPPCEQADACGNIIVMQLRLRMVIIVDSESEVAFPAAIFVLFFLFLSPACMVQ